MRQSLSVDGALEDPLLSHSDGICGDFVAVTPIHQTDPVTLPTKTILKKRIVTLCARHKYGVSNSVYVCVATFRW